MTHEAGAVLELFVVHTVVIIIETVLRVVTTGDAVCPSFSTPVERANASGIRIIAAATVCRTVAETRTTTHIDGMTKFVS